MIGAFGSCSAWDSFEIFLARRHNCVLRQAYGKFVAQVPKLYELIPGPARSIITELYCLMENIADARKLRSRFDIRARDWRI